MIVQGSLPGFVKVKLLKRPIGWIRPDQAGDVIELSERRAQEWVDAGIASFVIVGDSVAPVVAALDAPPDHKMVTLGEVVAKQRQPKRRR